MLRVQVDWSANQITRHLGLELSFAMVSNAQGQLFWELPEAQPVSFVS